MPKPAIAMMIGAPKESPEPSFKAPEGFDLEDKKPGDTVEAVVTLEIGEDGTLTVKKLNGIDLAGGEQNDMMDEPPKREGGFTDAVMGGGEEAE